jgi:hypothetical protein
MTDAISIDAALRDPNLLGAALGDPSTWQTWRIVLKAAFGVQLNRDEARAFASVAGGRSPPTQRVRELWAIIGRRGGKSRIAAALAVYFACFVQHRLAPGERGMVLVLAASVEQAKVVFNYALAFLTESPVLCGEVVEATRNEIRLRNGIVIAIHSNSFRTSRGRTLLAVIFDEVAYWRDESSATPDLEVYRALLPGLSTTNGMLIGISTPYRKLGLLHQKHREHFGVDGDDVLVVQGTSKQFNPSLADNVIAAQRAADPAAATSEWDAEFRPDIGQLLDDLTIEANVDYGRPLELPPRPELFYRAFTDASGGRSDYYGLAIGHKEHDRFIVDVVRGVAPPFDPSVVTKEFADLIKQYRCYEVHGDFYAAAWTESAWRQCAINYTRSELAKSEIYLAVVPLFTRGVVNMPDHTRLIRELRLLERHTHRSGRDTVDHGKGGHDDHANSLCGLLHLLSLKSGYRLDVFKADFVDLDKRPAADVPAANQRLAELYRGIANGARWGAFR